MHAGAISLRQLNQVRYALSSQRAKQLKHVHDRMATSVRPFITPKPPPTAARTAAKHSTDGERTLPLLPIYACTPAHPRLAAMQAELRATFASCPEAFAFFDNAGRGFVTATNLKVGWERLRMYHMGGEGDLVT